MPPRKELSDTDRALAAENEKRTEEKLDLMRTRLDMLGKINPDLPGAIKTALKAQSDQAPVALYRHDIENNQKTYVTGSMAMLWSIDEPLEFLYERLAKNYVREAGHYIVKLIFSKINPEIPDIEIAVCLEPPYIEPPALALEDEPSGPSQSDALMGSIVDIIKEMQEQNRLSLQRLEQKIETSAPREDPVIKMLSEQNKTLISAFTQRAAAPATAPPPTTMNEMIASLNTMLEMTGKVRNLTGEVMAPVGKAADSFSGMLDNLNKIAEFKKSVDGILGGKIESEVNRGAAQIVTNERSWRTVLMNLVEQFGEKAMPTISQMLGRAVINATQKDINELAAQVRKDIPVPPAPSVVVKPVRAAPPSRQENPGKNGAIITPFPGSPEATLAKFKEVETEKDNPPTAANIPELLNDILQDMSDPTFVQHEPDGGTYANAISEDLDRLLPGWWEMYHDKPEEEAQKELKAMCYGQCPGLAEHEDKMTVMVHDLHTIAKQIAAEESGDGQ